MKAVITHRGRWGYVSAAFLLSMLLVTAPALAQNPNTGKEEPAKAEKKLTGRLPAYFGQVVTKEQREQIYSIQAKFGEQLMKLREQIDLLEKQQTDEVYGVLSPEQRATVEQKIAEAKARRTKSTAATGSTEATEGSRN